MREDALITLLLHKRYQTHLYMCATTHSRVWRNSSQVSHNPCVGWLWLVNSINFVGLFCKRALWKRQYSAKETYHLIDPTNRSHPILVPNDAFTRVTWLMQVCHMPHSSTSKAPLSHARARARALSPFISLFSLRRWQFRQRRMAESSWKQNTLTPPLSSNHSMPFSQLRRNEFCCFVLSLHLHIWSFTVLYIISLLLFYQWMPVSQVRRKKSVILSSHNICKLGPVLHGLVYCFNTKTLRKQFLKSNFCDG